MSTQHRGLSPPGDEWRGTFVSVSASAVPSGGRFVIRRVAAFKLSGPSVVFASRSVVCCGRAVIGFFVVLGRAAHVVLSGALSGSELFTPTGDLFASLT